MIIMLRFFIFFHSDSGMCLLATLVTHTPLFLFKEKMLDKELWNVPFFLFDMDGVSLG